MKKLLIIGAGGHGRVIGETAAVCGYSVAYLDDQPGPDVVGSILELEKLYEQYDSFFVGIDNNMTRRVLTERLKAAGVHIATLIHPTAYISPTASIGEGTIVEPKAIVNTNSKIGVGVIISVGAIVDHDSMIEDYAHINAGAICMSGSKVETGKKIEAGEVVHGYN
jgi:UDP-N-acetylbacillosamine N-acetyltransferase